MRIRNTFLAAAITVCLCAAGTPAAAVASLQSELDDLQRLGIVGIQAHAVGDGGERAYTSGHADDTGTRPVPANGEFRIASNTKTFLAAVVMQLVAEGRLRLTDTVEQHLPGVVRGNGNDGSRITVRNLLQHTSGLYDYWRDLPPGPGGFEQLRYRHFAPEEMVATTVSHPPDFAPGARFAYSNTGYVLAGMIIERVTGRPWGAEVTDRVITPLGLRGTRVPGDDPRVGMPHARAYQQWEPGGPLTDTTEFNPSSSGAAGQIISTGHDLLGFFRALLGGRLLPPAQLEEMLATVPAGGESLGYGIGIYRKPLSCGGYYFDHGGNTFGVISRSGLTRDGKRGITMAFTGAHGDSREDIARLQAASDALVDKYLCQR